jgi:hypothetical protein
MDENRGCGNKATPVFASSRSPHAMPAPPTRGTPQRPMRWLTATLAVAAALLPPARGALAVEPTRSAVVPRADAPSSSLPLVFVHLHGCGRGSLRHAVYKELVAAETPLEQVSTRPCSHPLTHQRRRWSSALSLTLCSCGGMQPSYVQQRPFCL